MNRAGLLKAAASVLAAAEAGGAYGRLHEPIVTAATLCRALVLAPEAAPLAGLPGLIRWTRDALDALRPHEGKDVEACRRLLGALRRLAAEELTFRTMPAVGRPC